MLFFMIRRFMGRNCIPLNSSRARTTGILSSNTQTENTCIKSLWKITEETSQHLGASGYNCSESFREQSDKAVNEFLKRLYQETRELLVDKKELMIILARQVFRRESMSGKDFYEFYEKQTQKVLAKKRVDNSVFPVYNDVSKVANKVNAGAMHYSRKQ